MVGQPELAPGNGLAPRRDERAHFLAGQRPDKRFGFAAGQDQRADPKLRHPSGRKQLRMHAPGAKRRLRAAHGVQIEIGDILDDGHGLGLGMFVGIFREHSPGRSQVDEQIRPHRAHEQPAQAVVVAIDQLGHGHRIVLVDHRHRPELEKRGQRIAQIEIPFAVVQILPGEQHLGRNPAVQRKFLIVGVHEPALPDGRGSLSMRQRRRIVPLAQHFPSGRHGAAGNQQHLPAAIHQFGNLRCQLRHHRRIHAAMRGGQNRAADLDHHPTRRGHHLPPPRAPITLGHGAPPSKRMSLATALRRAACCILSCPPPWQATGTGRGAAPAPRGRQGGTPSLPGPLSARGDDPPWTPRPGKRWTG